MRLTHLAVLGSTLALAAATLSGCGGGSDAADQDTITIGVSLSMTGALGALGPIQKAGYEYAVQRVNDAGGLDIDGTKHHVNLIINDNKSDATLAGSQGREMVLKDDVTALLSGCSPVVTLPVVQVAEAQRVPMMVTCNPTGVFTGFSSDGLKYSWDMFFNEQQQAKDVFDTFDTVESNKKVALFTDNEPDGVAQRQIFKSAAEASGYEIVGDYTFAVGTTDFTADVNDAKDKGAQLVLSQSVLPDGIALYKQIKALGLHPVAALAAKAASSQAWYDALGSTADGTLTTAYWAPGGPLSKELKAALSPTLPSVPDQGIAVASFSAAETLMDAIARAGSTDPDDITAAIASTDLETPVGTIKFDAETHTAPTDLYVLQWENGDAVQVSPKSEDSVPLTTPVAGLE